VKRKADWPNFDKLDERVLFILLPVKWLCISELHLKPFIDVSDYFGLSVRLQLGC